MILRSWHGIIPIGKAESFKNYLIATEVAEVKIISGNLGVYIYNQSQNNEVCFYE